MRFRIPFGLACLMFLCVNMQSSFAQTKYVFSHDNAGNRIQRYPEAIVTPQNLADIYLINGRHVHVWPNPLTSSDVLSLQVNDFNGSDIYTWRIVSLQGLPIRQGTVKDANAVIIPNMGFPGSYVLYFTVNAVTGNITVVQQ